MSKHVLSWLLIVVIILPIKSFPKGEDEIVMLTMNLIPYGFYNTQGEATGVLFDVMNQIIDQSKIGKSHHLVPINRKLSLLAEKRKICALGANTSDIVAKNIIIEPINYLVTAGVISRSPKNLNNYESLKQLVIAVPQGVYFDEKFAHDPSLNKVDTLRYLSAVKNFQLGYVDAIAGAIETIKYVAEVEGVSEKAFSEPFVFQRYNIVLYCTPYVSEDLRKKLRTVVKSLNKAGVIANIIQKYDAITSASINVNVDG